MDSLELFEKELLENGSECEMIDISNGIDEPLLQPEDTEDTEEDEPEESPEKKEDTVENVSAADQFDELDSVSVDKYVAFKIDPNIVMTYVQDLCHKTFSIEVTPSTELFIKLWNRIGSIDEVEPRSYFISDDDLQNLCTSPNVDTILDLRLISLVDNQIIMGTTLLRQGTFKTYFPLCSYLLNNTVHQHFIIPIQNIGRLMEHLREVFDKINFFSIRKKNYFSDMLYGETLLLNRVFLRSCVFKYKEAQYFPVRQQFLTKNGKLERLEVFFREHH